MLRALEDTIDRTMATYHDLLTRAYAGRNPDIAELHANAAHRHRYDLELRRHPEAVLDPFPCAPRSVLPDGT